MPKEMASKITEGTLVPVSLILTICGGVLWLTTIYAQGAQNKEDIAELTKHRNEDARTMLAIDERLSRMEGMLEQLVSDSATQSKAKRHY